MRLSKKRKQQLANMSLDQLRQVLIRDIRKIPRARIKQMLRKYQYCQQRIDGNLDHIQQLRSRMQKVTVTYRDAPGGGGTGSDAAELIGKILQLENMVKEDTERLRYELTEVQFWIDSLDNYQERSVLQLRYVNGYAWPDIADRLYYSLDGVFGIHDRALKNLLDLYKKHSKTQ